MESRTCYGCKGKATPRKGGVWAFDNAYWHRACFARATPKKRLEAHNETRKEQGLEPLPKRES